MKRIPIELAVAAAGVPCNPVDGFFLYEHHVKLYYWLQYFHILVLACFLIILCSLVVILLSYPSDSFWSYYAHFLYVDHVNQLIYLDIFYLYGLIHPCLSKSNFIFLNQLVLYVMSCSLIISHDLYHIILMGLSCFIYVLPLEVLLQTWSMFPSLMFGEKVFGYPVLLFLPCLDICYD